MANFDDLLSAARLPEKSVPICLRGDLQVEFEQLEQELADAQEADARNDSLAGGGQARKVAERMEALSAEMREHTHPFVLRALSSREWRELVDEHPPRKNDDADALLGANSATFPHAMLAACCIDPVMTVEQVAQLTEKITDGQALTLFGCGMELNRGSVDVPKSAAASALLAKPALK